MTPPTRRPPLPPPAYRRSPAPPPPVYQRSATAPPRQLGFTDNVRKVLGIGSAVAIVIGSLLTWVSVSSPLMGTISAAGTRGDGKITLVVAGVIALVIALAQPWGRVASAIGFLVCAGVAVYDAANIHNSLTGFEGLGNLIHVSVGFGLWVVIASSVLGLVTTLMRSDPS
jgi:hypothetical protein